MRSNLSILPVPTAIEAAWNRYASLMRAVLDTPELAVNRQHMEETARAELAWREAFQAGERRG